MRRAQFASQTAHWCLVVRLTEPSPYDPSP